MDEFLNLYNNFQNEFTLKQRDSINVVSSKIRIWWNFYVL